MPDVLTIGGGAAYTCSLMYVCLHVGVTLCLYVCMYVCMSACMCVYVVYVCMCVCVCLCVCLCIHLTLFILYRVGDGGGATQTVRNHHRLLDFPRQCLTKDMEWLLFVYCIHIVRMSYMLHVYCGKGASDGHHHDSFFPEQCSAIYPPYPSYPYTVHLYHTYCTQNMQCTCRCTHLVYAPKNVHSSHRS